jgi:hypothetical protein
VATRDHWSVRSAPDAVADAEAADVSVGAPRWATPLSILEFFLYTGLEVGAGVLAYTLLTEGRGVSDGAAGLWTTS